MSTMLRAFGREFDVDRFLASTPLPATARFRRGEAVLPMSRPDGRRREKSGVNVPVSDAEFEDFPGQVADSITFLTDQRDALRALRDFPGVEGIELDFGVTRRDVAAQCDTFPPELVRLAGELGFGITLSQYPGEL